MNSNIPIFYDYQNAIQSKTNPLAVYKTNNETTHYFARYILQKLISVFDFENLPDTMPENYLQYVLFCNGVVSFVKTDAYGVIPQACGLTGYNVFWQPRSVLISNPLLPDLQGRKLIIGRDCEIVKVSPDYCGLLDLVYKYATEYALVTQSFDVTVITSKLAYAFGAGNKQVAESFKKMVDEINEGRPAVFIDRQMTNTPDGKPAWQAVFNDGGSTILNDLLTALEKLDARLNTDIGIPNVNISKASGVTDAEVNANNTDTKSKAQLWLDTMNDDFKKVNAMFDTTIKVSFKLNEEGVIDNADKSNNDSNRSV